MTMPGQVPTVDVAEADRRLRDDPDRPVLLDVREADEFAAVRAPGALLIPISTFQARLGDVPADRPMLVDLPVRFPVCGRDRLPGPHRPDRCRERRGRHGGMGQGRPADALWRPGPGEGDAPG